MKSRLLLTLAILLFVSCESSKPEPPATSDADSSSSVVSDPSNDSAASAATESINQLLAKHEESLEAYREAMEAAPRAERRNVHKEMFPDPDDYLEELQSFAEANPDDPVAGKAFAWIVVNVRQEDATKAAMEQLFDKHIDNEVMKDVCRILNREMPSQLVEDRFETLIEKSPHDEVKGTATYGYASYLSRLPDMVEFAEDPRLARRLGEEGVSYLKDFEPDESKVESLYDSVVKEYGDLIGRGNKTLGELAERALFEIRHLSIGREAPEIEGEDFEGESFKLSDYRGKVVMIDFWGDW